ncbi:hypothetical protein L3Q82_009456 [Scortum barcoo]|uniref:Uncharacterized protein n=1 Tax=Scortum barcoo TaxID=214431 RepID=A0ACB8WFT4_9TELE|nr:hypothetical protein L3Q82_009456 [Scortum barcoo]
MRGTQEPGGRGAHMLKVTPTFDLHRDVVSDIFRKEASVCRVTEYCGAVETRILNIEGDGGILYSWKGATGTTRIGKYDSNTKKNKVLHVCLRPLTAVHFDCMHVCVCAPPCSHVAVLSPQQLLYTFDKQVCVSSCSLNKEETLLVSKCLTLLIEIHPINNTKVLKAVDCRVKVQFLQSAGDRRSVLESHLLLLTEDGYVDLYHVLLTRQEGYRVVMANPERLSRTAERIVEDFCWVQWDGHAQRLYYVTHNDKFLMRSVQFYPNHNCETMLEVPLELPANSFRTVKFVNLGFDHYHVEKAEQELVRMKVFTSKIGSMCVCWSQPLKDRQELIYTLVLVHKGYYILVYLRDHFLHCINTRQQEMPCHSLFLSGPDADLGLHCQSANVTVLHAEEESGGRLLDLASGSIHTAELRPAYMLQILRSDTPSVCPSSKTDPRRLAALHCLLVYMGGDPNLELKVIEWLCDNVNAFESFDPIQEFILASLYRISYQKSLSLDKVLPHSSVHSTRRSPVSLLEVPGVSCTTELHTEATFKGKARSLQGFWSELQWNTERTKYLDAVPNPRYRTLHIQADWDKLRSERRPSSHMNHMEENTKKVLSTVDTWCLDKKLVPLFQEEDHQQRALIGLTVDKLREHLNRHLPRLGKKKIDSLVVNYVAKLLELIRHMLESVWLKYKLGPRVLCLAQQGSPAEWSVFHFMFRILEATRGLCLPLPPGYHTLLAVFAVRCLPHHTFLQYIDHGVLQLTETFVSRLMTVTYLTIPLKTYQHQDVCVRGDAEEEEVKEKLTDSLRQSRPFEENDHADGQAEQAQEVRQRQVEEQALRHGGAVQVPAEPHYHQQVGGDAEQAADGGNHTGDDEPGIQAGGQRLPWEDLDNGDANERLKFSVLKRLPEPMEQRIYHMWDHPVSSASISRDYVRTLLEKHNKNKGSTFTGRDKPGFRPEFLPLTYLAKILSDIEDKALNPFEEQENVDARFVEETALKQTLILLGYEEK